MKYRPVKQRRRLRPRWDHLLFPLLSPSLPLSSSVFVATIATEFIPLLPSPLSSSSPKLGRSHPFALLLPLFHSRPSILDPPLLRSLLWGGFRSDDFNLSSGRKRSGTRSEGVTLTLPFFIFSSPSFYSPLFLFLFSHRCLRLEARRRRRRGG